MESVEEKIARLEAENQSLKAQIRAKAPRQYTAISVILASWETSTCMVAKELDNLTQVLEDRYKYTVHQILIPGSDSTHQLKSQIKFLMRKKQSTETLWVFMYGGHGGRIKIAGRASKILTRGTEEFTIGKDPYVDSGVIQQFFTDFPTDAVLIYDCCFAATTTGDGSPIKNGTVTDLLASSGFDTEAPGPSPQSFTYAMTKVLQSPPQEEFSIKCSYYCVFARLENTSFTTTPVYTTLTEDQGREIVLRRLPPSNLRKNPKRLKRAGF